jgi:hypothetical protein
VSTWIQNIVSNEDFATNPGRKVKIYPTYQEYLISKLLTHSRIKLDDFLNVMNTIRPLPYTLTTNLASPSRLVVDIENENAFELFKKIKHLECEPTEHPLQIRFTNLNQSRYYVQILDSYLESTFFKNHIEYIFEVSK